MIAFIYYLNLSAKTNEPYSEKVFLSLDYICMI